MTDRFHHRTHHSSPAFARLHRLQRQRGVTLVELIAAIVILAIALVGITAAVSSATSRSSDTVLEARAVALAQSYLDEILARRFDENSGSRGIPPCFTINPPPDPALGPIAPNCTETGDLGPDGAELPASPAAYTRANFNDVDDYHGLSEGDGQPQPLLDADGLPRIGYDNFRVTVSVGYIDTESGGAEAGLGDLSHPEDAKRITVTVYHRDLPQGWQFSAYKANF